MSKRKARLSSQLGAFLRQYARPSDPHSDPNDRRYDRRIERQVQRLSAEEFDALAHGDDFEAARRTVEASIAEFLQPDSRARFRRLIASKSGRAKLIARYAHADDWMPEVRHALLPSEANAKALDARLATLGAPPACYVVSECEDLDGAELPLRDALEAVIGSWCGTVVVCIPGRLAYYEGEEARARYVLRAATA